MVTTFSWMIIHRQSLQYVRAAKKKARFQTYGEARKFMQRYGLTDSEYRITGNYELVKESQTSKMLKGCDKRKSQKWR